MYNQMEFAIMVSPLMSGATFVLVGTAITLLLALGGSALIIARANQGNNHKR